MNVNVTEDTMHQLVAKAIFDGLDHLKRDELVVAAIKKLLQPENTGYSRKPTPLQEVFESAVREEAKKIISGQLEKDEDFKASVSAVWRDAWMVATTGEAREKLVVRMAAEMAAIFKGDRNY